MSFTIALLPGDGIGPEVTSAVEEVLSAIMARHSLAIATKRYDFGGAAIDNHGSPFPAITEEACQAADAVFLGAVGGPKWEDSSVRPEQGLLALRKTLGVYANLRPISLFAGMEHLSPLKPERATGTDMLIVRELTGGLYFGEKTEGTETASDLCTYSRTEVERVAHVAFDAARSRRCIVTSVDKANVLASSRLWRTVVKDVAKDYSDVALEHVLVDAMAMKLIERPAQFDVILTENLFGDILSDEASAIPGSIGLAPSASIGSDHGGLYEPIHGSAPDIAGQGKANPVGAILSLAMLLRLAMHKADVSNTIENAVRRTLADGIITTDLGGTDDTAIVVAAICDRISDLSPP